MLSDEGNENGEKNNNRSSWQKKTLHLQHTCFVHFFAVVLHDYKVTLPETSWLHVLWRKCRTFSFSFFFSLPHFFTLVAVNISYFPIIIIIYSFTVRFLTCQVIKSAKKFHKNFHVALPTKKCVFCLLSLALVLSLSFFLLSFVGLSPTFSFSLSLSFSVFQNCGHDS